MRASIISAFIFILFPAVLFAGTKVEPVYIEADRVEINEKKKVSLYSGSVSFRRGGRRLTAETIRVYGSTRDPEKVVANGSPARFEQPRDEQHKAAKAEAQTMEYFINDEKMVMEGEAQFLQEKNLFSGNRIVYDLKADQVTAQGKPKSDERVKIVIFPEEKTDQQGEAKQ